LSKFQDNDFSIIYKEVIINKIKLYEFELTNNGFIDIDDFEIKIIIEPEKNCSFIKAQAFDNIQKVKIVEFIENNPQYILKRPFLNMIKKNKSEKIYIQVFSDNKLNFKVIGGGKGWYIKYKESEIPFIVKMNIFFLFSLLILMSYKIIINQKLISELMIGEIIFPLLILLSISIYYLFKKDRE